MIVLASSRHFPGPPNCSFIMFVVLDALEEMLREDCPKKYCY